MASGQALPARHRCSPPAAPSRHWPSGAPDQQGGRRRCQPGAPRQARRHRWYRRPGRQARRKRHAGAGPQSSRSPRSARLACLTCIISRNVCLALNSTAITSVYAVRMTRPAQSRCLPGHRRNLMAQRPAGYTSFIAVPRREHHPGWGEASKRRPGSSATGGKTAVAFGHGPPGVTGVVPGLMARPGQDCWVAGLPARSGRRGRWPGPGPGAGAWRGCWRHGS